MIFSCLVSSSVKGKYYIKTCLCRVLKSEDVEATDTSCDTQVFKHFKAAEMVSHRLALFKTQYMNYMRDLS